MDREEWADVCDFGGDFSDERESEWSRSDDDWKMRGFVHSNIDARSVKFHDKLREVKRNYENCRDPTIFVDMQRDFKRKYEI